MKSTLLLLLFLAVASLHAQDSLVNGAVEVPRGFVRQADQKIKAIDHRLTRQSEKYLRSLRRQEEKIYRELSKTGSSGAAGVFGDINNTYASLSRKINDATGKVDRLSSGEYIAGLDSLQGTLAFLKEAVKPGSKAKDIREKIGSSLNGANQLQHRLQGVADVQAYLQQRQSQIRQLLSGYTTLPKSIGRQLGKYRAEAFYYEQQVREYRQLLHEPDKLVRKTLSHLSTVPAFQQFMSKYSMLAVLFPTPEHYGTPQSLGGLQSRAAVMQTIQQRLPVTNTNGGAQYLQQQIQQAQSQLAEVKDKLNRIGMQGAGSSDMAVPDFKPNGQKTKSFLQRIELGADVQTRRSDYFFPVTTETGLTAGYRLTDKSVVGIGLSGKIGWGRDWKHIRLTGEGIGLRVYADWKAPDPLKTNSRFMAGLWFTAGAEMNYNRAIESFSVFKNYSSWTKSALAGLKKKYSISSPVKKGKKLEGNLQVLYDFLYRQHVPPTPALMWRVGYGL